VPVIAKPGPRIALHCPSGVNYMPWTDDIF
jgi:hypothetical protein